ncbi:MAG: helix-turn-helix transcriptional regulator [Rudaea sp.]|uniref:helix-turn-helix domain-containing protein n=1 Tax=Rudaea sp. TaxID=2136325 RepID=UPI0039E56F42
MLNASFDTPDGIVVITDKKFYAALGQRIAERRKSLGLTQQQLADELGIAQQTLAHYEVGRLRVAAALLPAFSKALGLSLDELFGEAAKAGKRGPAPKLQAQIERIGGLPRSKQRMLLDMLDAAINSANAQAA